MTTRFVIASFPRSGTHMLRTALNRHVDCFVVLEHFNEFSVINQNREFQSAKEILWQDAWRPRNYEKAVGVPIHLHHGSPWKVWEYLHSLPNVKYITMRRENKLNRALSHILADETKQWQAYTPWEQSKIEEFAPDPKVVLAYLKLEDYYWSEWLKSFGDKPKLDLVYEDMCENWADNMAKAFEFLGLDRLTGTPRPATYPTTQKRPRKIVTNWDEIEAALRDTKWEEYLNDPLEEEHDQEVAKEGSGAALREQFLEERDKGSESSG